MNTYELQSKCIETLRFPLAMAVIFQHSFIYIGEYIRPIDTFNSAYSGVDFYNLIGITISRVLVLVAVPCFFFISGYLFYNNQKHKRILYNKEFYQSKILKRFKILWNLIPLIYLIYKALKMILIEKTPIDSAITVFEYFNYFHAFWDSRWIENIGYDWLGRPLSMSYPANIPLWFVRDLIVAVIISPILGWLLQKMKLLIIVIFALFYTTEVWPQIPGLSIRSIFFFSLGAYLAINQINIVDLVRKIKIPSLLIFIPTTFMLSLTDGGKSFGGFIEYPNLKMYTFPLFVLATIACLFIFVSYLIEHTKFHIPRILTASCFFLYAGHMTTLYWKSPIKLSTSVLTELIPDSSNVILLICRFVLIPVFTALICFTIFILMNKICPKLTAILSGNRN